MCLRFSSCQKYIFFQIKRILSSQKNILAHRKAIISLTRTWNETNDRTKKEQTRCHTGRMCWRARAYAVKTNNVIYQQNVTYCVKVFISLYVMGERMCLEDGYYCSRGFIIFQPKENDGFNSDVIQRRPLCNHYSHQQTDSCVWSKSYKSCFWVLVCTHHFKITSELKHARLELTSKTKLRLLASLAFFFY